MDTGQLTTVLEAGSAAFGTNILVASLTYAFPNRPSWAAPIAAFVLGILLTIVQGVAAEAPLTASTLCADVLQGIIIGGAAIGIDGVGKGARAHRATHKTRVGVSVSSGPKMDV